ncbi:MAG: glycosyltransferase family 4 protein [Bacillota bacterium]
MKILHLISGGDNGGAKTHVITLLRKLIEQNIDVELLCIMEGSFTREAIAENIPTTIIAQRKRYSVKPIMEIKKYIKNGNYDIVHCHGARANYIAYFLKNSFRIPFITTLHSDYKLDFKDSFYKQAIFMPINAVALRKFDYILAVTNGFLELLLERGFPKESIKIIYNGIRMDQQLDCLPKEEFLSQYGLAYEESKTYIGLVARLQMVKGIWEFVKSAEILLKTHQDLVFLIAGNGDMEKEVRAYLEKNDLTDNILLLGFVSDMNSFYNVIDLNALTSYSESFPYALLEGARVKKATVSTAVGGIPEMIQDGVTGYLAKSGDPNDIAEKMEMCITNPEAMQAIGNAFYEDVDERFSDVAMANRHIEIYNELIKEKTKHAK